MSLKAEKKRINAWQHRRPPPEDRPSRGPAANSVAACKARASSSLRVLSVLRENLKMYCLNKEKIVSVLSAASHLQVVCHVFTR